MGKKEKKKVKVVLKPAKTENKRTTGVRKTKISKSEQKIDKDQVKKEQQAPTPASPTEVKTEIKKEAKDDIELETSNQDQAVIVSKPKTPTMTSPKLPMNGKVKTEDEGDDDDEIEDQKSPKSPSKNGPNACPKGGSGSPSKLGLPDTGGLIVGVNTINYDASSSVRNKAKSREEHKMEMIMKAIEAMEKAEQRKGGTTEDPTKRRRSSSSYRNDSNLDASSADETKPEPKARNRKKGRKSGPGTPQR